MKSATKKIASRVLAAIVGCMMILSMAAPAAFAEGVENVAPEAVEATPAPEDSSASESATSDGIWYNQSPTPEIYPENPENGVIVFMVASMPEDALNRSVKGYVSYGPADEILKSCLMNGTNGFISSVEVEPGSYYCTSEVTNDPAMDYPVEARDDMYTIDVTAGSSTIIYLDVSAESFIEQLLGKPRFYTEVDTIPVQDGYDVTKTGQIGCYLTVPETFGGTVIIYVENLFTGDVKELDLYATNDFAIAVPNVTEGIYQIVGSRVLADNNDDESRFEVTAENEQVSTKDTTGFHVTITDKENPDAVMVTPSRDNNQIVQKAEQINNETAENAVEATPTPTVTPTATPVPEVAENQSTFNIGAVVAIVIILLVFGGAGVFMYFWHKNQNAE